MHLRHRSGVAGLLESEAGSYCASVYAALGGCAGMVLLWSVPEGVLATSQYRL
jgi:hypothetical protein